MAHLVLAALSMFLLWTKIKYTVKLNERAFIIMFEWCLQMKLLP